MVSSVVYFLLAVAALPLVYYLLAIYCLADYLAASRKSSTSRARFTPAVSILKPVRGVDRGAYENFASFCRLDYPNYEIVFAVAEAEDPVVPLIQRLQRDFPDREIRLITGIASQGSNKKIDSLRLLADEAKYEILVMADSDVRVQKQYLREVVSAFADPKVGGVTTLYRCIGGGTIGSDLNALGMPMESMPHAIVARKLEGGVRFAFGWTMATTKTHLRKLGGWEAMANCQNDDFELGNRLARHGYGVELIRHPVSMVFSAESMCELFRHELRWSVGLKNVRRWAYRGMLFTHGLPWSLTGAAIAWFWGWKSLAVGYLLAYVLLRLALTWMAAGWGLGDRYLQKRMWLFPFRDAVNFGVWLAAFFHDEIEWRGMRYKVRKGLLVLVNRGGD
jgi:ceramide glucosyltransferase